MAGCHLKDFDRGPFSVEWSDFVVWCLPEIVIGHAMWSLEGSHAKADWSKAGCLHQCYCDVCWFFLWVPWQWQRIQSFLKFIQCQNVLELHTSSLSRSSQLSVSKRPRIARQSTSSRSCHGDPTSASDLAFRPQGKVPGACIAQAGIVHEREPGIPWQAFNISRCEDSTGVQKCIKVHAW